MIRLWLPLFLLLLPSPAFAWWEYGHDVMARIAWIEAQPRTRDQIAMLLGHARTLEAPGCPARSLAQLSYWPDCIRMIDDRYSHSAPWHYQSIDICRPFDPAAACPEGNCVSAQIERNRRRLADHGLPPRERAAALAFLLHLVADLHQPLHVSDHGDLGGQRLAVGYGIAPTSLHFAWDGYLADRSLSSPPRGARGLLSGLDADEKAAMRQGQISDWARETWGVSRDFAYGSILADPCGPPPAERPVIDEATARRLIPIVRRQAARAGLRLARLLDEALA